MTTQPNPYAEVTAKKTKTTYAVYYEITNTLMIEASSPEEAREEFDKIDQRELGELGMLEAWGAMRADQ